MGVIFCPGAYATFRIRARVSRLPGSKQVIVGSRPAVHESFKTMLRIGRIDSFPHHPHPFHQIVGKSTMRPIVYCTIDFIDVAEGWYHFDTAPRSAGWRLAAGMESRELSN